MWVVFFATLKPENLRSLRLYVSFTLKTTSGMPSVSTGNRKTPSRSLSQKNLTYTKLLDEAWYCLAVCMSTCRMETKTVDALYLLVWFKQCDLYDLENEHQCGATSSSTLQKNKKPKSLRKANKECSPFQWYVKPTSPKKNMFFSHCPNVRHL